MQNQKLNESEYYGKSVITLPIYYISFSLFYLFFINAYLFIMALTKQY